jgi:hypothetical protein
MPIPEQTAEETQAEGVLPDGVNERTAAEFEKLKLHNKALAEKVAVLEGSKPSHTSVLDEIRPSAEVANTTPIAGNIAPLINALPMQENMVDDSGYVNTDLLNRRLSESERRAIEAEKRAQEAERIAMETQRNIQTFQESESVRSVHAQYPHLDPNNIEKFDPIFYGLVKNELLGQMGTRGRGKENLQEAARNATALYASLQAQPTAEAEKAKQAQVATNRIQASATTGTSKAQQEPVDVNQQVALTRKGDRNALFARLQASGN